MWFLNRFLTVFVPKNGPCNCLDIACIINMAMLKLVANNTHRTASSDDERCCGLLLLPLMMKPAMGFDGCMHSRQAMSNQSVGKDACAVVVHKEALVCFIFKVVIKPSVRACTPPRLSMHCL